MPTGPEATGARSRRAGVLVARTLKPSPRFAKRVRNRRLRLTIRVRVTDRAGNVTVVAKMVRVIERGAARGIMTRRDARTRRSTIIPGLGTIIPGPPKG